MKQHRQNRISSIAKQLIIIFAITSVMVSPRTIGQANAQVFILSEDEYINSERLPTPNGMVPVVPQGGNLDWILAPVGNGVWLLLGLGGAYLFGKRRKQE